MQSTLNSGITSQTSCLLRDFPIVSQLRQSSIMLHKPQEIFQLLRDLKLSILLIVSCILFMLNIPLLLKAQWGWSEITHFFGMWIELMSLLTQSSSMTTPVSKGFIFLNREGILETINSIYQRPITTPPIFSKIYPSAIPNVPFYPFVEERFRIPNTFPHVKYYSF